ncbi:MAG TPA: hypothetical protein VH083_00325 [Myxococcales bacterium]|jgi:hypothetical protein|nr:hypothetical protein [Myxococcales bacterium]
MLKRLALVALMTVACGGSTGGSDTDAGDQTIPDAGQPDAGQPDAGQPDAGQPDAGQADAGPADAGQADAGQADAGQADAGQSDAGTADAGTVACRITITGALNTTGICDGVGALYEITPDAFFADTGASIDESGFALEFSAALKSQQTPISFSTADSPSWDFGVQLAGSAGNWQAGFDGVGTAEGSFQVTYTNAGTPLSRGTVGTAFLGTHGTIDGILPPGNNSTAPINVHIDF